MMGKQMATETLIDKMMEIVNDNKMIEAFSDAAKTLGISAKEWNNNKALISSLFACELIQRHSKENKD